MMWKPIKIKKAIKMQTILNVLCTRFAEIKIKLRGLGCIVLIYLLYWSECIVSVLHKYEIANFCPPVSIVYCQFWY